MGDEDRPQDRPQDRPEAAGGDPLGQPLGNTGAVDGHASGEDPLDEVSAVKTARHPPG